MNEQIFEFDVWKYCRAEEVSEGGAKLSTGECFKPVVATIAKLGLWP